MPAYNGKDQDHNEYGGRCAVHVAVHCCIDNRSPSTSLTTVNCIHSCCRRNRDWCQSAVSYTPLTTAATTKCTPYSIVTNNFGICASPVQFHISFSMCSRWSVSSAHFSFAYWKMLFYGRKMWYIHLLWADSGRYVQHNGTTEWKVYWACVRCTVCIDNNCWQHSARNEKIS